MNYFKLQYTSYRSLLLSGVLLLLSGMASAQEKDLGDLQKQFTGYQQHHFQEKVYVHLAKSFYLAGEIIWFKVYNVDGYLNRPLTASAVSYVELIAADNKPVLQASIEMSGGTGNGSFAIPSSVPSGNYTLRAYTSWMKNFGPDYYFVQPITIVNTLKGNAGPEPVIINPRTSVQFFPEGGNLVYGLQSTLAFKATDEYGRGVDCRGFIMNSKQDTLARFQAGKFGMGHFAFLPRKGEEYKVFIISRDSGSYQNLPRIYDNGYVMHVAETTGERVKIELQASSSELNLGVYLLVQGHQLIRSLQYGKINSQGLAEWYVDLAVLGEGLSSFTVFNAQKQPVCERLYFKRETKPLVWQASTSRQEYGTRDKIEVDLQWPDSSAIQANLSLSVFQTDSMESLPVEDIRSYLELSSELKGKIESPAYYFDRPGPEKAEALDNLLLTQGWRRFRWEDVLTNQAPVFDYLPEWEGPLVMARITDKTTRQPLPNTAAYLSAPGKRFSFAGSVSNRDGMLRFNSHKFYGKNNLIVQSDPAKNNRYTIDVLSPYSEKFSANQNAAFYFPERWKQELLERSINMQVENTYRVEQKRRFLPPPVEDSAAFYGKPDREYYLDDYTRFNTMEEVLREYIKEVRLRKPADKYSFQVRDALFNTFFEDPPLVLVDGVPALDAGKVVAMDPLKVKKIEIMSRKTYLGSVAANGIISYRTYEGDLAGYELDPSAIVVEYDGLQRQREFYSPVYTSQDQLNSRIPDYRNLLAWIPGIKLGTGKDRKIVFYSSDLAGRFIISIQGITADGKPLSALVPFTVKASR